MISVRPLARLLLSSVFLLGGVDALRKPHARAELARPVLDQARRVAPQLPDDDVTLVRINAAVQVGGGLLLSAGRFPRLAALMLAGSLIPTTFGGHRFWEHSDPAARAQQRTQVAKNAAILGGLLYVATDRPGKAPQAEPGG
ncbi:MAG TPA: DoxX family protein [Mycobacteriales bacterium]|nr:DoxX family protein [Mycobacteriales bacterium]